MTHTDTTSDVATAPITTARRDGTIFFGPDAHITPDDIERIALNTRQPVAFSAHARSAMEAAERRLEAAQRAGQPIYGITTGFGPHVASRANPDPHAQGCDLINHLAAGAGPWTDPATARAIVGVRCHTLAQGYSGISDDAALALLAFLARNIIPAVPSLGSVGASGDLIPLAHIARALTGEGHCLNADDPSQTVSALAALGKAGLNPTQLSARDALAIVNGTAFMTAHAALAVAKAERLIDHAEALTAWLMASLRSRKQSLHPSLHDVRKHPGQILSAHNILARSSEYDEAISRPLQEVYSIRCAPQILGACRDQLTYARGVITTELNGVNDNPIIAGTVDEPNVIHGGNFQGQQIAFAADTINHAITQAALLIERQIDVVANPSLNGGAPLLLAADPGATSGIAGAQITATALAAELRRNNAPSATATIPTNGRNQDVVSMGAMAARVAHEQTANAARILAAHAIAVSQLNFLRASGITPGEPARPPRGFEAAVPFSGFIKDRALHGDLATIAENLQRPLHT